MTKSVKKFLEVDPEDLTRAVKTTTGATKKRSKKISDSDSENSDFEDIPKKVKVPKKYDPLLNDHKIINHVDKFEDHWYVGQLIAPIFWNSANGLKN